MQRQVLKMLEGSAADAEPTFADNMYLPDGTSVSGAEWKRLIDAGHVYIWLDYFSVPVSWASSRALSRLHAFSPPLHKTARALTQRGTRSKSGPTTGRTKKVLAT